MPSFLPFTPRLGPQKRNFRFPDQPSERAAGQPERAPGEGASEDEPGSVLCAACRFRVTDFESVTEVNGRHDHTFANPSGMVFHIGCFSSAEGCSVEGAPTVEFTWFPGHEWSFALCRGCGTHLGWHYSAKGRGFYGLILARLVWARADRE